jgi:uncharacterized protein YecT (DUF1311 family)
MRQIVVVILLCLGLSTPALAAGPSFDCAKATTAVEKAICASGDLSALDLQIAEEYNTALSAGHTSVADQRTWWAQRDKVCAPENTVGCLRQVLLDRHAFLTERPRVSEYQSTDESHGLVTVAGSRLFADFSRERKDIDAFLENFNLTASQSSDEHRVVKCDQMVVEIRTSKIGSTYGGICAVSYAGQLVKAMACYSDERGGVGVQEISKSDVSEKDLVIFSGNKC